MVIHIDSIASMMQDLSNLFGMTQAELCAALNQFDWTMDETRDERLYHFINTHKESTISEVGICHLTSRLRNNDLRIIEPLNVLFTSDNVFRTFLEKHGIQIVPSTNSNTEDKFDLFYNAQLVELNYTMTNPCMGRLKRRLTDDFYVTGFISIPAPSSIQYDYYHIPEIIHDLSIILNDKTICDDYESNSTFYCTTVQLPLSTLHYAASDSPLDENTYIRELLEYMHRPSSFPTIVIAKNINDSVPIQKAIPIKRGERGYYVPTSTR